MEGVELNPVSSRSRSLVAAPWEHPNSGAIGGEMEVEEAGEDEDTRTRIPCDNSQRPPGAIPVPELSSSSAQGLSSPFLSVERSVPASSFGRNCAQPQSPAVERARSDDSTSDQLHGICTQQGYCREVAQEVPSPRLASMDAAEGKRIPAGGDGVDASETIAGKRKRGPVEGVMDSDIPTQA